VTADLIDLARDGDGDAFRELVAPHESELRLHCYRLLGSLADAEDALQEALLAAWKGLDGFEGRASIRTWLYRIATTRCLNALRSASRRPTAAAPPGVTPPEPTRLGEVTWVEPYPDLLLEGLADVAPGPEAWYEARESISLAFVVAVQRLSPHQRAVLILRDVLGFPARDAAEILGVSGESVTSALKRARAALRPVGQAGRPAEAGRPPEAGSADEKFLVARLTAAYEAGDVDAIIALFSEDAWLTMPPMPFEYQGRDLIRRFLADVAFCEGRTYTLVPTRVNGQLAFAAYPRKGEHGGPRDRVHDLLVLTLAGPQISAMTRFAPTSPVVACLSPRT
jgi:RNA polymerase sigma-70 factor, ECF subfamily